MRGASSVVVQIEKRRDKETSIFRVLVR
jgi:hypothetical protein